MPHFMTIIGKNISTLQWQNLLFTVVLIKLGRAVSEFLIHERERSYAVRHDFLCNSEYVLDMLNIWHCISFSSVVLTHDFLKTTLLPEKRFISIPLVKATSLPN